MTEFTGRPYLDHADQQRVIDLLLEYRAATRVDTYWTRWRFRLLLTSRVWEPAHDTCLWEDAQGRVVAFAMLWRRRHDAEFFILDRIVQPTFAAPDLLDATLTWADQRARAIATERGQPATLFASELEPSLFPDNRLAIFGFEPVPAPSDTQNMAHNVYFARSLQAALPESVLPEGYSVRTLHGEADIEPYQALYDFAPVSAEHRRELLSSDEYSHLVVVDPSGEFAAYCESSICQAEWQLSGQRIGWIDYIGTRPERQRQGLGRAVLLAALHWLQAQGARTAMLATVSTNVPATSLYTRAGFTRADVVEPRTFQKAITLP